jgi:hypothetical protein
MCREPFFLCYSTTSDHCCTSPAWTAARPASWRRAGDRVEIMRRFVVVPAGGTDCGLRRFAVDYPSRPRLLAHIGAIAEGAALITQLQPVESCQALASATRRPSCPFPEKKLTPSTNRCLLTLPHLAFKHREVTNQQLHTATGPSRELLSRGVIHRRCNGTAQLVSAPRQRTSLTQQRGDRSQGRRTRTVTVSHGIDSAPRHN